MSLLPFPERESIDIYFQTDDIYDYIGQGTFATVFKAVCLADVGKAKKDQVVALKVFYKKSLTTEKMLRDVVSESEILRHVDHPHCVRLLDCFQTAYHVVIVTDFIAGKELFQALKEHEFTEAMVRSVMQQLLDALSYLHNILHVVHRDVKPENILVTPTGANEFHVTLIDFGLARKFGRQEAVCRLGRNSYVAIPRLGLQMSRSTSTESFGTDSPLLATPCGTLKYAAPETIRSINQSGQLYTTRGLLPRIDVYAAGIIMYVMLCGALPFSNFANKATLVREMEEGPSFSVPRWLNTSSEAVDLNRRLLQMDPQRRPHAYEALQHAWFCRTSTEHDVGEAVGQRIPVDSIIGERDLVTKVFDAMKAPESEFYTHELIGEHDAGRRSLAGRGGRCFSVQFPGHMYPHARNYFDLPHVDK